MNHRSAHNRLGRIAKQRKALVRNLMTSLLRSGKVRTTQAKASVLVAEFDELVTSVRRQKEKREQIRTVKRVIFGEEAQRALFEKVVDNAQRSSGYTRTTRLGPRSGDSAEMILVELFSSESA